MNPKETRGLESTFIHHHATAVRFVALMVNIP